MATPADIKFWIIVVQSSGIVGMAGWLSMLCLALAAVYTAIRYWRDSSADIGFYGIAHVQFFFFLLAVVVNGIRYSLSAVGGCFFFPMVGYNLGLILLFLAMEAILVILSVVFVGWATQTRPRLASVSVLGVSVVCIDIIALVGSLLLLLSSAVVRE